MVGLPLQGRIVCRALHGFFHIEAQRCEILELSSFDRFFVGQLDGVRAVGLKQCFVVPPFRRFAFVIGQLARFFPTGERTGGRFSQAFAVFKDFDQDGIVVGDVLIFDIKLQLRAPAGGFGFGAGMALGLNHRFILTDAVDEDRALFLDAGPM